MICFNFQIDVWRSLNSKDSEYINKYPSKLLRHTFMLLRAISGNTLDKRLVASFLSTANIVQPKEGFKAKTHRFTTSYCVFNGNVLIYLQIFFIV